MQFLKDGVQTVAHTPYPQPHELANKFSSNKKKSYVFSPRNSVIGHL